MHTIITALTLAIGFAGFRRLRMLRTHPRSGRVLDRVFARLDAGPLAERCGWRPTYGYLQHVVIESMLSYRTVSVTGEVWLPSRYIVEVHPDDWHLVAHLRKRFSTEMALVLETKTQHRSWRMDGTVDIAVQVGSTATALRPRVEPIHQSESGTRVLPPTATADLVVTADMSAPVRTASASPSNCVLLPLSPRAEPVELDPNHDAYTLGRSPDADATIDIASVSWSHARLDRTLHGWTVCDLGSSNGTILNGRCIDDVEAIESGDILGLGQHATFQFVDRQVASAHANVQTAQWSPSFS